MKHVVVIGLGYIGLPTALITCKHGFTVHGFDVDHEKIDALNAGICPIEEHGLAQLLQHALVQKTFHASHILTPADVFIIAVPTPFKENKKADLSHVWSAAQTITPHLRQGNLIILESTVPVGTTEKLAHLLEEKSELRAKKDFFVTHCPERVLPGKILHELVHNDRVIGGICANSTKRAEQFYKTFVTGNCYLTNDKTAEMVKLVENSYRDVNIAFANQVAAMSEQANINPFDIIKLANKHPRVNIHQPGCGVGGHCIAVDPWFLIETFPEHTKLLHSARIINNSKPKYITEKIISHAQELFTEHNKKLTVLILGLTYKPDVDDLRESPALQIAQSLHKKNDLLNVSICEPHVSEEKIKKLGFQQICLDSLHREIAHADIIAILVQHTEFKTIDDTLLNNKIVFDPTGLLHENKSASSLGTPSYVKVSKNSQIVST